MRGVILWLLGLAALALILWGVLRLRQEEARPASALPIANKVVVIDAGHGGFDAGAVGGGLEEKELNLDVALRLREYVEQGGGIAVLTRDGDVSTAEAGTSGITAKRSDLEARRKLASDAGADVFVSIHMNKFPQSEYRGAQVFYSAQPEDGKRLGEAIQQALKDILQDGNRRQAKKTDGGVLILKNTAVPSVLVECGFLSNPEEAALLSRDDYRRKLAWSVYVGLVRYMNQ